VVHGGRPELENFEKNPETVPHSVLSAEGEGDIFLFLWMECPDFTFMFYVIMRP
jgi:hypothetical protein